MSRIACFAGVLSSLFTIVIGAVPLRASAYELRRTPDGKVLAWRKQSVTLHIDDSGASEVGGAADAIQAGFMIWTASGVPLRMFYEVVRKSSSLPNNLSPGGQDNQTKNVVRWEKNIWSFGREVVATTVSTYDRTTGAVIDSDVLLNGVDHRWAINPRPNSGDYDIQNVVAHEAGHFFGLGHAPEHSDATMFPTTPPSEQKKRSLSDDDRQGIAALIAELSPEAPKPFEEDRVPENQNGNIVPRSEDGSDSIFSNRSSAGCHILGAEDSGVVADWFAYGLIFLALWRVRRKRRSRPRWAPLVFVFISFSGAHSAHATLATELSADELTKRASVILRGSVENKRSYFEGAFIYTDHKIAVTDCLKGKCDAIQTLRVPGGAIGNIGMRVDGMPLLTLGQEVIVFSRRIPNQQNPVLAAIGGVQGVFTLRGKNAYRDLRGLRIVPGHDKAGADGWQKMLSRFHFGRIEEIRIATLIRKIRSI